MSRFCDELQSNDGCELDLPRPSWQQSHWNAFVDITYASFLALTMCKVGDSEDAKQALQDAYLAMHRMVKTKRWQEILALGDSSARQYLKKIVVNSAINLMRKRREVTGHEDEIARVCDAHLVASADDKEVWDFIMAQLEPKEVVLLTLRFAHDLSYGKIAAEVGDSEDNVKHRVNRLLKRLRNILRDYE